MYGSVMAQPDEMTEIFFVNCTRVPLPEVKSILKKGKRGRDASRFRDSQKIYGEAAAKKQRKSLQRFW